MVLLKSCSFDKDNDFSLLFPIISDEDDALLTQEIYNEEIKEETFDLAPDKSPAQMISPHFSSKSTRC